MARLRNAPPPRRSPTVVAIGASAGGLESLGRLLKGLPRTFPTPILVVLHLDPHHRSQAVPLLQRRTKLHIQSARTGVLARAGHVYLAPPNRHLEIRSGKLRLTKAARVNYSRPSVDHLFASVAADYGPGAIGVVLSGAGSDGAVGLTAIKARGGQAVAEDVSTAKFSSMPGAAGRTGLLDAVLPADKIPEFLQRAVARRIGVSQRQWLRTLALLEEKTGAKFAQYRSTTLHRRLQQRMAATGCQTMASYLRLLGGPGAEANRLHAAFLIKVSSFLRDPGSWRSLDREIAARARSTAGLRAWSAGCATGEEAYTLAMLLARHLGTGPAAHWKVYGTDLDEAALTVARSARYTDQQVARIPKGDLRQYFVREGTAWRVRKALRDHVVFGRQDLLHNPPLSGIDVLACRNVLIYFKAEERQRTVRRLSAAVIPGGILFLGRSEGGGNVTGFDRVGVTTLFRRTDLGPPMATRKKVPPTGSPATTAKAAPPRVERSARLRQPPTEARMLAQQDLNEELQSRNEELETVNEELQSLNDELSTMEEQMRGLGEESRRANDFLRLLLDTSPDALVACDASNHVSFWNKAAVKRFRLSALQAVGGELFGLVPALGQASIRAAAQKVRQAGRGGRVTAKQDGVDYLFDPLPASQGKRRGYLLRVRSTRS